MLRRLFISLVEALKEEGGGGEEEDGGGGGEEEDEYSEDVDGCDDVVCRCECMWEKVLMCSDVVCSDVVCSDVVCTVHRSGVKGREG